MVADHIDTLHQDIHPPARPSGAALVRADTLVVGEIPGRPPGFIDRGELADLSGLLTRQDRVVVCAGGRGVGKSVLAAAYAREQITDPAGAGVVVWISGETETDVITGLGVLARHANLTVDGEDAEQAAARARDYLNGLSVPGLLVIDNAETPERLTRWLPTAGACRILLTSTDQVFTALAAPVHLGDYTREQSLAYLAERTGLDDPDGARQVADELGDLPLALAQAAGVITAQHLTYRRYLDKLTDTTLTAALPPTPGYPRRLPEAVLLSVQTAALAHPHARAVLDLLSVLDPTSITRTLLADLLDTVVEDHLTRDDTDEVIGVLARVSLITFTADDTAVVMHRLIGRTLREIHPDPGEVLTTAAQALRHALPGADAPPPPAGLVDDIAAQTLTLLGHPAHPDTSAEVTKVATTVGIWLYRVGAYTTMVTISELVLAIRERVLGPDHPATLTSRSNLAGGYWAVGRYQDAITLDEQTLATRERVLGPEHPHTLDSRSNLANGYRAVGRHQDAITLHEQTLATSERVLGPDHPDTLTSRNDLAVDYWAVGRHPDAITLHEQTLATSERVLGPDHPNTLQSRNNLANGYWAVGRHQDAITLDEQTLATRERVLGPDHPDTLGSRSNLAVDYQAVGRHQDAITLDEQTLATRERVLGPEHPDTLTSRSNLALDYRAVGRAEDARQVEEGKSPR